MTKHNELFIGGHLDGQRISVPHDLFVFASKIAQPVRLLPNTGNFIDDQTVLYLRRKIAVGSVMFSYFLWDQLQEHQAIASLMDSYGKGRSHYMTEDEKNRD